MSNEDQDFYITRKKLKRQVIHTGKLIRKIFQSQKI